MLMTKSSPAEYWSAEETRHIDGIADRSLAPAFAVNKAAFFSAEATASGPVDPLAPMDSKSAWCKIIEKISPTVYGCKLLQRKNFMISKA
jgi:hypothetical protein